MARQKIEVKIGDKYGRFTIIEEVEPHIQPNGKSNRQFRCSCSCGNERIIHLSSLRRGNSKSCGCYLKEITSQLKKKHGGYKHYLYKTFNGMKERCMNPNNKFYKNYGARGIKVCERWLESFAHFLEDMGERPNGHTIDRINNDGNYEPSNCKWATKKEQQNNTRRNKCK